MSRISAARLRRCGLVPRYIQGPGAVGYVGTVLRSLGVRRALVVGGRTAMGVVEAHGLFKSLEAAGVGYLRQLFGVGPCGAECCDEEIGRISRDPGAAGCDAVVGVGGGRAIDVAKAVAHSLNAYLVTVPTVASSTAPCTSLSVIYTCDHVLREYRYWGRNPDAVVVDTRVIAEAPTKYLACGIGDAVCRYTEVRELPDPGVVGGGLELAAASAKLMVDTVLTYGEEAVESVERGEVSRALEVVVEAVVLHSQIASECGGFTGAVPHALYNGFTYLRRVPGFGSRAPPCHGELVFFGLLVDMVLRGYPRGDVERLAEFGHRVGLATTLSGLGFGNLGPEELEVVAEAVSEEVPGVSPAEVARAVREVSRVGAEVAARIPPRRFGK